MNMRHLIGTCALGAVTALVLNGTSAQALTMKECSAKYKAAQTAGTVGGVKWNDFRKAQCGTDASAAATPAAAPAAAPAATTPAAKPTASAAKPSASTTGTASSASAPAAAGNTVFPTAVSTKYSKESAGKARMHTCLDQYNANKASGGNGGLVWIKKGGGYYSECNKRLTG